MCAAHCDQVTFIVEINKTAFSAYRVGSQFPNAAMLLTLCKVSTLCIFNLKISNSTYFLKKIKIIINRKGVFSVYWVDLQLPFATMFANLIQNINFTQF